MSLAHRHSRAGFTLIETLIVIAITALLSAVVVGYSNVGKNQIALSVEDAKISQLLLQAKSLSIATYGNGSGACGYGVAVSIAAQTYSLFAYHPAGAPPCPSALNVTGISSGNIAAYTQGTFNIPVGIGVRIWAGSSGDNAVDTLFYPPDPQVFISRDGSTFMSPAQTSKIYLKTVDGSALSSISISPAGQISF